MCTYVYGTIYTERHVHINDCVILFWFVLCYCNSHTYRKGYVFNPEVTRCTFPYVLALIVMYGKQYMHVILTEQCIA